MIAEERLFSALSSAPGVTALIGDRLYPMVMPEGAKLPVVVYQLISGPRVHSLTGQSGLATVRIQITTWAGSYIEGKNVTEAIRLALSDNLSEARIANQRDRYEADTKRFGSDLDVVFMNEEPK